MTNIKQKIKALRLQINILSIQHRTVRKFNNIQIKKRKLIMIRARRIDKKKQYKTMMNKLHYYKF
jgi:hypothetical protein